jgi:glycosyltransferase involved in cell wall biosynthesis
MFESLPQTIVEIKNKSFDFCLLIPCYNNFEGLIASLRTVNYFPGKFMVLIVDDGSKIPVTSEKIKLEVDLQFGLFILRNEINKGVTDALNKGLEWIEENNVSKFIARLDCSDLCNHDRFYKQMEYLSLHPDVGLLGSWCVFENKNSSLRYLYKTPSEHDQIKKAMYFRNVFIHPTIIFKTELLKQTGYYPADFNHAEDYAFFWQLIKITHTHILDEFLVTCEINDKGISLKNRKQQLTSRRRIVARYGTNVFLKTGGIFRIWVLLLLPKRLALFLRSQVTKQ